MTFIIESAEEVQIIARCNWNPQGKTVDMYIKLNLARGVAVGPLNRVAKEE